MIKRIVLKNFQSHGAFHLDLKPDINVIRGPSDIGKSSVIRGIQWALFNRPSGTDFIRHGEDSSTAIVQTEDHLVKRRRGKKVNTYTLDGHKLEAFGSGSVDGVVSVFNLDDVLNFQNQHDGPFLLSETPGQISRRLNSYADMDSADALLKEITSRKSTAKSKKKDLSERLRGAEERLETFDTLPSAESLLEQAEGLQQVAHSRALEAEQIEDALTAVSDCEEDLKALSHVSDLEALQMKMDEEYNELSKISVLCKTIEEVLKTLRDLRVDLNRIPDIKTLEEHLSALEDFQGMIKAIFDQENMLQNMTEKIDSTKDDILSVDDELSEILNEWESIKGSECPTCGGVLT